jgi:hypothetical protein
MGGKPPTLVGLLVPIRGPLLALLVLAAFSATMQSTYEQDREAADLAQTVLLVDQVLNRTCWPGAVLAVASIDDPTSYRCSGGSDLLIDYLEAKSESPKSAVASAAGASRLWGIWQFKWRVELLDSVRHSLWMRSESLQLFTKEQVRMAKELADPAPRFFVIYADIDKLTQPRPDRHGVVFVTAAYRDQGSVFGEARDRIARVGSIVAISSWFYSSKFEVFAANSLEAAAIETARAAGYPSKRPDDAYAMLTAAVARSTVTVPLINLQLSPRMAALALLICAVMIQLYARGSLNEIVPSTKSLDRRARADPQKTGRRLLYIFSVALCAALPLVTGYWAFGLMEWAPFRSLATQNGDWFGEAINFAFVVVSFLTIMNSAFTAWRLVSFKGTTTGKRFGRARAEKPCSKGSTSD